MALPVLLLLMMALTAIGHGALVLSDRELQATWAFRHFLRAETAAKLGLALAWAIPSDTVGERTPWVEETLVDGQTSTGLHFKGIRRWIGPEFFLLEGVGRTEGWRGERRTAWIGWVLSPTVRVRALLAADSSGSEMARAGVPRGPGEELWRTPQGWSTTECDLFKSSQKELDRGASPGMVAPVFGTHRAGMEVEDPGPSLGLLSLSRLLLLSEESELPHRGEPSSDGSRGCPPDDDPVFLGSTGDILLRNGRHCGLLVTAGDLRLAGDSRFQGLAVVGGDLILENGGDFEGLAEVRNRFFQAEDASFRPSLCPVLRALAEIPTLQKPIMVESELKMPPNRVP
ncbi:MAG: hypothetical protein HKO65_12155 [Gemmatimonadetes bacterium]|nr:hypothetical protein [Gemmatimonadota bacterium]